MTKTILIPLPPSPPETLPALLHSLRKYEVLMVAREATPETLTLASGNARLAANTSLISAALKEAKGEALLFLSPYALPNATWANSFDKALAGADLVAGKVDYSPGRDPYAKAAAALFKGRVERTMRGHGYTFPWGSFANLAVKRTLVAKVGELALAAGPANEIDWCWRALFTGAVFAYEPKAAVKLACEATREEWLIEFEALGSGEAWVQSAYRGLLDEPEPLLPAVISTEAYLRIRRYSAAGKIASLAEPLEELAAAFAAGTRVGIAEAAGMPPPVRGLPKKAISWWATKKDLMVFVPGKGVTTLSREPAALFLAWRAGAKAPELISLYRKLFRVGDDEAEHGVEELLTALRPAGPVQWVKV